jgi:solute carrier family 25 (mitochondrial citrate transporter), member 1
LSLGTNQAANFTVYVNLKAYLQKQQPEIGETLPGWQTMIVGFILVILGFISGACGPLFNAPIDTIKTRIQKTPSTENGWVRFVNITKSIIKNEGYAAFYKGLTPRVLRVAPGQSITFLVSPTYPRYYDSEPGL